MATLNINNTDNQVTAVNANQSIIITDNNNISNVQTSVSVTQPVTSIVLINTLGPQGIQGVQGPSGSAANINTSSFVTTSSFNTFTSSYQIDSSSFDIRINNLVLATSSYVLNSATSSFVTNNQTSSFVQNSQTSSFVQNNQTSSFITNSQTSSMAVSSSLTSSFLIPGTYTITSSWAVSASRAITSSYADYVRSADIKLFAYSRTPVSCTSIGSEDILATILIPSGTLGNNDSVEITKMLAISSSNTSSRVIRTRLNNTNAIAGSTVYSVFSNGSTGSLLQAQILDRIVQSGSNGQEGFGGTNATNVGPYGYSATVYPPSSSFSNSSDMYILLTGTRPATVGGGDIITLRNYDVKINRA